MHTTADLFLMGKPLEDTPERDECTTLSSMGLRLVSFETSAEEYLIVFPETAYKKTLLSSNK